MKKYYTIGQVAKYLNISVEAIRFYEKKGIIPEFIRDKNNYRLIDHTHLLFLKGVVQLKEAGFSLKEIKTMNSDVFSLEPEKQYDILYTGIGRIQEQIDNLEKTKEKLSNDISELKTFYSFVDKGCFIEKIDKRIKIIDLNHLTMDHLLSDDDMFFSIEGEDSLASHYLLKAFLYKTESDIEKVIVDMMAYIKKNNLSYKGPILLKVKSAASYYTGDALAAFIYIGLEEKSGYKNRV